MRKLIIPAVFLMGLPIIGARVLGAEKPKPNVIVILTDDQGYGDLSCLGNPWIKTPNLDKLHSESVRFTNFHSGTTCAPTRASLMTGKYSNRVGVWHTVMGRSILNWDEVTVAQVFEANDYSTSMFGKWHLGDNYPNRPQDKGFQETLIHKGGGVGQSPDYWGNTYFDDTYFHNGVPEKQKGYCTDVWFKSAIDYMGKQVADDKPFFCYLALNAPHAPMHIAESYALPYRSDSAVVSPEYYGMIANIDENVGILEKKLAEWGIKDNTIVVFMTDNGTSIGAGCRTDKSGFVTAGYNAGMRGTKSSEYEGGHRVPLFIRWPGKLAPSTRGKDVSVLSSCIDFMPTMMGLCNLSYNKPLNMDGMDLSAYAGIEVSPDAPDRILFVDTQREDFVTKWKKSAVMTRKWRLINGMELYQIDIDAEQRNDVADKYPDVVSILRGAYENWWIHNEPAYSVEVPIALGSDKELVITFSSHDYHSKSVNTIAWDQTSVRTGQATNGYWAVAILTSGKYQFELYRWPKEAGAGLNSTIPAGQQIPNGQAFSEGKALSIKQATLKIGDQSWKQTVKPDDVCATFTANLKAGQTKFEGIFNEGMPDQTGAYYVNVKIIK
jgi:arylsulfatase A-like enzyme